jgi:homogentisate 1,2-dioxygenase
MPHYRQVGALPAKRHTRLDIDGRIAAEELIGEEGFSGFSSLLYHRNSPSAITTVEALDVAQPTFSPTIPLRPHHLPTWDVPRTAGADLVLGRQALLGNDDLQISWVIADATTPLYRNATGDELIYIQSGAATFESVFGEMPVGVGDYVVVPAGITHRWVVTAPVELLVIEARGHVGVPRRYLTERGQLREGAPYCERDIRGPVGEPLIVDGGDVEVIVRTRAGLTRMTHRFHPFDVVGWDGCMYPWALNIRDFEPLVGRVHQPPPIHQTFEGPGFVVCSFTPRPLDFDPNSITVPYHHSNVDSDEMMLFSEGNYAARSGSGIDVGSISFHPAGFIHGPHPGAIERSLGKTHANELAVMIDTFKPLGMSALANEISDPNYPLSWSIGS